MRLRFIGDIHGDLLAWRSRLDGCDKSIQVGDFGMGFIDETQPALAGVDWTRHRFIRGNHDDPARCAQHPGWIPDGHFDEGLGIFFCGGAWSIDREWRTPGVSWWPDEEVSDLAFRRIIEDYARIRPRIVVTHDIPFFVADDLYTGHRKIQGPIRKTRTAMALYEMFKTHQPALWVFGHWHIHRRKTLFGTRFICCEINQSVDIDAVTLEELS